MLESDAREKIAQKNLSLVHERTAENPGATENVVFAKIVGARKFSEACDAHAHTVHQNQVREVRIVLKVRRLPQMNVLPADADCREEGYAPEALSEIVGQVRRVECELTETVG